MNCQKNIFSSLSFWFDAIYICFNLTTNAVHTKCGWFMSWQFFLLVLYDFKRSQCFLLLQISYNSRHWMCDFTY